MKSLCLRRPIRRTNPERNTFRKSILSRSASSSTPYKINIIRTKPGLGDILMLTPALLGVREKFPNAEITLVVNSDYQSSGKDDYRYGMVPSAVQYLPYIDKIVDINKENINYNLADFSIDISGNAGEIQEEKAGTKSRERIDIFSYFLGTNPSDKRPFIHVPEHQREQGRKVLESIQPILDRKLVVITVEGNSGDRNLPLSTIIDTINLLKKHNSILIVTISGRGVPNLGIPGIIELRDLDFGSFYGLVSLADLVVSPDTGTLHLAGALNKRIVGIWGNTHPRSRTSYYKNITNIWHKDHCPKAPCWYSNRNCKNRVCLKSITGRELSEAILTRLGLPILGSDFSHFASVSIYAPEKELILPFNIDYEIVERREDAKKDFLLVVPKETKIYNDHNWLARMITVGNLSNARYIYPTFVSNQLKKKYSHDLFSINPPKNQIYLENLRTTNINSVIANNVFMGVN